MQSLLKPFVERPLLALASGLALGIAGGVAPALALPPLPAWACLALAVFFAAAACAAWLRSRPAATALFFLLAGACAGLWRAQGLVRRLSQNDEFYLPAVRVEAQVSEDYGTKEESGRRALRLSHASVTELGDVDGPSRPWDGDLRVSYEPQPDEAPWGPGDRVRLYGSLHGLTGPMNPGEFDFRGFMLGRGITASLSLRQGLPVEILSAGKIYDPWRLAWLACRWLTAGLEMSLSPRSADLARGMVLGDTGGLTARDMSVYSRTGLVHILSVSGLHLALALAIFLWLGKKAGVGRRRLAWFALFGSFFYAMVCGMPVPCQRALFLFGLALIGEALDLDTDVVTSLAFGACIILLEQPGALFEAGCQLSFVVSLSLVALTSKIAEGLPGAWPEWLKTGLSATAAAEFATIPLVAWHFNVYCWPSLFASIATAPLMGPIVGLGLGTAALGHGLALLAWPLEWTLRLLDWITAHFAALPHAAFSVGKPALAWMLLWPACGLALLASRRQAAWAVAMAGLLVWMLWPGLPWAHRHPGLMKTWFLAVGQGDSSLTEFEDGSCLLVDAGPMHPDAGSWTVGPALRFLGINGIDWAVVTHPHADHYGGMFWVCEQFKVGLLAHSGEAASGASWQALEDKAGRRGVSLLDLAQSPPPAAWGPQGIECLSPLKPRLQGTKNDMHNNNVVLRVGGWMLLMGDMQSEGEARLLKRGMIQPVELLKAGHHGSRTSTTPALLKALKPKICVIQCGAHNRYRHPSPQTLGHLAGLQLARNDLNGCIFVEHDAQGTRLQSWRPASQEALFTAPPKQARSLWKKLEKQGRLPAEELEPEAE